MSSLGEGVSSPSLDRSEQRAETNHRGAAEQSTVQGATLKLSLRDSLRGDSRNQGAVPMPGSSQEPPRTDGQAPPISLPLTHRACVMG